jgi:hypothetical protein
VVSPSTASRLESILLLLKLMAFLVQGVLNSGCSLSIMSFFPLFYLGLQFKLSFWEGGGEYLLSLEHMLNTAGLGNGLRALASWPRHFSNFFILG